MIKKVKIQNIESHKDTEIEFGPGLNVITGSSDNGKSAILNAINWVIRNVPRGTSHKSWFSKSSEPMLSKIDLSEGVSVTRYRTRDENCYKIDSKGFDTVGNEIPREVEELLNIGPYNLSGQIESYFLLQLTPGEVAKRLNEVADLDIVDKLIRKINSLVRSTESDVDSLKSRVDNIEVDLAQFEGLDKVKRKVERIEEKVNKVNRQIERKEKIDEIIDDIKKLDSLIKDNEDWLAIEKPTNDLEQKVLDNQALQIKRDHLDNLVETAHQLQIEIETKKDFILAENTIEGVENVINVRNRLEARRKTIISLINAARPIARNITSLQNEINQCLEQTIDLLEEAKLCPFCGADLEQNLQAHAESWLGL